jgi:NAD(P)-dependent dehydrogenase (short-subunit alcohol dehydrogenase family)
MDAATPLFLPNCVSGDEFAHFASSYSIEDKVPKGSKIMQGLAGEKIVVVGGSMGVGRAVVALAHRDGAEVLAVARGAEALDQLAAEFPSVATIVADATLPETPRLILRAMAPDVLVLSAGAIPPMRSFFELGWEEFSANWNADVKASFLFCKAAIEHPLPRGAAIVLISSRAGIGGSPLSGGYAGAKRMQMFLAEYGQREAERLGLELRFLAIVPGASCLRLVWARPRLRVMLAI